MGISYHVAGPVLKLCLSLWASGYIVALFNFRSHLQITYRSCFAIPAQAPVSVQTWATLEITSYANMHWESHGANHLTAMLPMEQHIDFDLPGKVGRRTLSGLSLLGSNAPTGGQCEADWIKALTWSWYIQEFKAILASDFFVSVWKEAEIGSSFFIAVNWLFVLNCSFKKIRISDSSVLEIGFHYFLCFPLHSVDKTFTQQSESSVSSVH